MAEVLHESVLLLWSISEIYCSKMQSQYQSRDGMNRCKDFLYDYQSTFSAQKVFQDTGHLVFVLVIFK